jgi:hypothetical protein
MIILDDISRMFEVKKIQTNFREECMDTNKIVARALIAMALLSPRSFGQESAKKADVSPMEAVLRLHLSNREGLASLYYSACCRDRAVELQESVRDFIAFYKDKLGVASPITVAVLDENDWDRIKQQMPDYRFPYGMPNFQVSPSGYVLFIPADDKGVVTQHLLGDRQHATEASLKLFASAHLTYDEAVRRAILQLAYHEAGHTRVYEYGIQPPNLWLNEILANYLAFAYGKARDPQTAAVTEGFVKMGIEIPAGAYTSLDDFDAHFGNIEPANYDWYQMQFATRALEIYNEQGLGFVAKVRSVFPKGASKSKMSVAETLSQLEAISPGFQAWAKTLGESRSEFGPLH